MRTAFLTLLASIGVTLAPSVSLAVVLDPNAVAFQLPDQIKWSPVSPGGSQQAVLFGDPAKPGQYGVMPTRSIGMAPRTPTRYC
jgi:hypothetical protein